MQNSDTPDKPWIRAGYSRSGKQLWCHATEAQIKRAKEQGIPVHYLDTQFDYDRRK